MELTIGLLIGLVVFLLAKLDSEKKFPNLTVEYLKTRLEETNEEIKFPMYIEGQHFMYYLIGVYYDKNRKFWRAKFDVYKDGKKIKRATAYRRIEQGDGFLYMDVRDSEDSYRITLKNKLNKDLKQEQDERNNF